MTVVVDKRSRVEVDSFMDAMRVVGAVCYPKLSWGIPERVGDKINAKPTRHTADAGVPALRTVV